MHQVWQAVIEQAELAKLSGPTISLFFRKSDIIDFDGAHARLEVLNIFARRQFETKLAKPLQQLMAKAGYPGVKFTIVIRSGKNGGKKSERAAQPDFSGRIASPKRISAPPKNASFVSSGTPKRYGGEPNNGLNPRYRFANFIVGGNNDLAHAACQAVVEAPGERYNPLFIYGGVGLGKTHLIQAIGNALAEKDPSLKILYTTIEEFYNAFVNAMRRKVSGFSDDYRKLDVLIVDDMQYIAGKEKSQEEFFHTFNALQQMNKQVIISSDRPPREISTLTDRLRTRLEMGMAIDIQMPDYETRCAIISAKSGLSGVTLDTQIVEYLAENIRNNIRELEGVLNQLLAYCEVRGIEPTIELAKSILTQSHVVKPKTLNAKQIIDKTARYFKLDPKIMCGKDRSHNIAEPRQIAMYLIRTELSMSFPKIGREFSRDHSSVMHSVEKIDECIKNDFYIRQQVSDIREKLYG